MVIENNEVLNAIAEMQFEVDEHDIYASATKENINKLIKLGVTKSEIADLYVDEDTLGLLPLAEANGAQSYDERNGKLVFED